MDSADPPERDIRNTLLHLMELLEAREEIYCEESFTMGHRVSRIEVNISYLGTPEWSESIYEDIPVSELMGYEIISIQSGEAN